MKCYPRAASIIIIVFLVCMSMYFFGEAQGQNSSLLSPPNTSSPSTNAAPPTSNRGSSLLSPPNTSSPSTNAAPPTSNTRPPSPAASSSNTGASVISSPPSGSLTSPIQLKTGVFEDLAKCIQQQS